MKRLFLLLLLIPALALADEFYDSIRESQYEWTCEEADGAVVSGHTRQDKAVAACANRTLTDGVTRYVRSGVYRIVRLKDPDSGKPKPPPTKPEPSDPQVTFGPVTAITQYPNTISALKQDAFRWELKFTLNSVAGEQGLAGRDESGQREEGHLSVWVRDGILHARHQGIDDESSLLGKTAVTAGTEYLVVLSVERGVGVGLFVDGALEDHDAKAWGTTGNDLPLTLGGMCTTCNGSKVPPVGPSNPMDGQIEMAIYDNPLALPDGSVMLNWTNPIEDIHNDPLPEGIPDRISIYSLVGGRSPTATLDGESTSYEINGLSDGQHCFVATAWWGNLESDDSNTVCRQVAQ